MDVRSFFANDIDSSAVVISEPARIEIAGEKPVGSDQAEIRHGTIVAGDGTFPSTCSAYRWQDADVHTIGTVPNRNEMPWFFPDGRCIPINTTD